MDLGTVYNMFLTLISLVLVLLVVQIIDGFRIRKLERRVHELSQSQFEKMIDKLTK